IVGNFDPPVTPAAAVPPLTATARYVVQVYLDLLHRQAEPAGLDYWSDQLDRGVSRVQVAQAIQASVEYRTEVVQGLYQQFLPRAADPTGLNSFVTYLGTGGTSTQVQALISGSPEYYQVRGSGTAAGFLDAIYQDVLGRAVDPVGRQAFGAAL